jgi:hypothetical protein
VAKGDVYFVDDLTSLEIERKLSYEVVNKSSGASVCMTFAGNGPGVQQWILLKSKSSNSREGAFSAGFIPVTMEAGLVVAGTGTKFSFGKISCDEI